MPLHRVLQAYRNITPVYRDDGKESGNYYSILGLYWDNGKENGNYRKYRGYIGYILGL